MQNQVLQELVVESPQDLGQLVHSVGSEQEIHQSPNWLALVVSPDFQPSVSVFHFFNLHGQVLDNVRIS